MCIGGDVYNTTINVNGRRVFSSRYSPCCCNMYPMNSCFGFGYGFGGFGFGGFGFGGFCPGAFESGLGAGLGMAAGMALVPALPAIVKGVGKAVCWVGNTLWSGIKAVGKGIGNLFHKKSSTKAQPAE